jgi:Flp pilus assembly protein TadD
VDSWATIFDPKILENLRSLGYLGAVSPAGDRNLAAELFESGRFEEAERAYAKLVAEQPRDVGLRTSLAGALGALGRYDEALEQLDVSAKLDPLNPEAYHNRAVIR